MALQPIKSIIYPLTWMSLLSIIFFNFTSFSPALQITFVAVGLIVLYAYGVKSREKNMTASFTSIGLAALGTLLAGPFIVQMQGWNQIPWIPVYIGFCGILWILLGIVLRISVLHMSGWLALSLVHIWFVYHYASHWSWWGYQLMWGGIAGFFAVCYMLMKEKYLNVSMVLILVAGVQWVIPDLLIWYQFDSSAFFQIVFVIKLIVGGLFYAVARNV